MTERLLYQILRFDIVSPHQMTLLLDALTGAIPELNHLGIEPIGVFVPVEATSSQVIVVLPHLDDGTLAVVDGALIFGERPLGADPLYHSYSNSVFRAFPEFPGIGNPPQNADRLFQLRTYESPGETEHQKKVEMFESDEIAIFQRVGLNPVFLPRLSPVPACQISHTCWGSRDWMR